MVNEYSVVMRLLQEAYPIHIVYEQTQTCASPCLMKDKFGYTFLLPLLQDGEVTGTLRLTMANGQDVTGDTLTAIGSVAYYMFYQRELDRSKLHAQPDDQPLVQAAENRQNVTYHHYPYMEEKVFACIRAGRPDLVREQLDHFPEGLQGKLARQNELRSQKNLAITVITLATRAAIDAALPSELAFTMSDMYIQQIEDQKTSASIINLEIEAMCTFAARVRERKAGAYSRKIAHCIHYMYQNIYETLNLEQLADMLQMNATYLSSCFKREVGMPIRTYIQQLRIEEAKLLLRLTDHQLLYIGSLLHFHDQSYFTKVFKKHTGLTPRQYREQT
ncbi:helix-turn-helix domain-containing protein [Terribacillus sp. DMT04]|uniref:helix-turn-helix domain-containing protein n=1 Tax=Terribacillus sp. DMT04 TaxID=2850441 RepID=UPI001C2C6EC9|nr:helix-turn-helix domain-containing protein [Terribacillus sp. DMT04]QXE01051.1 helix-turn-helix domain-containing protein [Terribacillus sp. DMT04]